MTATDKKGKRLYAIVFICLLIVLALIAIRIVYAVQLDVFYVDEAARAGLVKAILTNNFPDGFEQSGALFFKTDADHSSVAFFGPAALWAVFFGYSITSLRLFMSIVTILAIILAGRAISLWYGEKRLVWIMATIIGLQIPWYFLQGMLFWDAAMAPIYIIVAFWAFSRLANPADPAGKTAKTGALAAHILLPLTLVASVYCYRAIGFLAVGLYIIFYAYLIRRRLISKRQIAFALLISVAAALPLGITILAYPGFTERANQYSIVSINGFTPKIKEFLLNWDKLLSFEFLFMSGDANRRQATGAFGGMLGLGAVIPLLSTAYCYIKRTLAKNESFLCILSVAGFLLGLMGAALSIEGNPHSLRSNGAWCFIIIPVSIGLIKLFQNRRKPLVKAVLILSLVTIGVSTIYYLYYFPSTYLPDSPIYFWYDQSVPFPFVQAFHSP